MASELAMSAVHNGRFHHATASWALEEQLATRRVMTDQRIQLSSRFAPSSKSRPFVRSTSSAVFSVFTDELSRVESTVSKGCRDSESPNNNSECPPGVVHTSQSDNSSNGDDDATSFASECHEDSAAGEWAAALVAVADQSMDKEGLFGRDRSVSESSSGSSTASSSALSKSPVGFWYVRPGSSSLNRCASNDDDEAISWSGSLEFTGHPHPVELPSSFGCGDASHIFSPSACASSGLGKLLAESSVAASPTAAPATGELSDPCNSADDELGPAPQPIDHSPATTSTGQFSHMPLKTMFRSMSYSAFTTHNKVPPPNTAMTSKQYRSASLPPTQAGDLFRTYYIKLVDLLAVRETEHLVHLKELKS
jgi:hypothetical protein